MGLLESQMLGCGRETFFMATLGDAGERRTEEKTQIWKLSVSFGGPSSIQQDLWLSPPVLEYYAYFHLRSREEEQVSFFDLSMMMKNRNGVSHSSAPAKDKLTLHTDQQSLILAEMMCARNKLQEENQQLRDRLQDAEMLIRLLHLKLEETSGKQRSGPTSSAPSSPTSSSNIPSASSIKTWRQKRKSQLPAVKQRDAFKNTFARAMRTFEPKSGVNSSIVVGVENTMGPQAVSRSELIQGSTTRTVSPERNDPVDPPDQDSVVLTTPDSVTSTIAAFRENKLSSNDDAHQMRSVIGMLAQSVINDYSTPVINGNE